VLSLLIFLLGVAQESFVQVAARGFDAGIADQKLVH